MKLIVIPVKFALKLDVSCLRSLGGIQILKEELAMCIFSKIQRFFRHGTSSQPLNIHSGS